MARHRGTFLAGSMAFSFAKEQIIMPSTMAMIHSYFEVVLSS
jgi:hypothetical protein